MEKKKKKIASIVLVLILTITATLVALPAVTAHDPPWTIPTWAYMFVSPDPVGVGQTVFIVFWIDKLPPTASGAYGDRWHNMEVVVTKPDGSEQNLGSFTSDPVGGAYTLYTPDQVGTYTFQFSFPGQILAGDNPDPVRPSGTAFIGDYFKVAEGRGQLGFSNPLHRSFVTVAVGYQVGDADDF